MVDRLLKRKEHFNKAPITPAFGHRRSEALRNRDL